MTEGVARFGQTLTGCTYWMNFKHDQHALLLIWKLLLQKKLVDICF